MMLHMALEQFKQFFQDYFNDHYDPPLPYVLLDFDGRSDYYVFINNGIPAGGLATGAEGLKTIDERKLFGGLANTAYDVCYHQSCDTVDNVNQVILEQNSRAAAYTLQTLFEMKDLGGFLKYPPASQSQRVASPPEPYVPKVPYLTANGRIHAIHGARWPSL